MSRSPVTEKNLLGNECPVTVVAPASTMLVSQAHGKPTLISPDISPNCPVIFSSRDQPTPSLSTSSAKADGRSGMPSLLPRCGTKSSAPPPLPRMSSGGPRLNKFVRRLHDMLQSEKDSSIVEWRRGLLLLHSTDAFAKTILPKYFNTDNFKTFRRQLNYYGFVHVRSFSTTGSTTTALWVNRSLAQHGSDDISSVLMLKRVEPCESAKTAEGRRVRKEMAIHTVEEDIGVSAKSLQMEQIKSMALRPSEGVGSEPSLLQTPLPMPSVPPVPREVHCRRAALPHVTLSPAPKVIRPRSYGGSDPHIPMGSGGFFYQHSGVENVPERKKVCRNPPVLNMTKPSMSDISRVSNSSGSVSNNENCDSSESEAEESATSAAANLLLMLSKSSGSMRRAPSLSV